jgi:hypothetical protein
MNDFLPLTTAFGVVLFLVNQLIIGRRNIKADRRKIDAYKVLLAEEIGLNIVQLGMIINTYENLNKCLEESKKSDCGFIYKVNKRYEKVSKLRKDDTFSFDQFYTSMFTKVLIDIASIDAKLFESISDIYSDIALSQRLNSNMASLINGKDMYEEFAESTIKAALFKLHELDPTLNSLYKEFTDRELNPIKITSYQQTED